MQGGRRNNRKTETDVKKRLLAILVRVSALRVTRQRGTINERRKLQALMAYYRDGMYSDKILLMGIVDFRSNTNHRRLTSAPAE